MVVSKFGCCCFFLVLLIFVFWVLCLDNVSGGILQMVLLWFCSLCSVDF